VTTPDVRALVAYLARLNVTGWTISNQGHLYVMLRHDRPAMHELVFERARDSVISAWTTEEIVKYGPPVVAGCPKDPFLDGRPVLMTGAAASSAERLLKELVGHKKFPIGKDIFGHAKRIRDEVKLASAAAKSRRDSVREKNARSDIKGIISNSGIRYGVGRDRILEIIEDEMRLMKVEDVMKS